MIDEEGRLLGGLKQKSNKNVRSPFIAFRFPKKQQNRAEPPMVFFTFSFALMQKKKNIKETRSRSRMISGFFLSSAT